MGRRVLVWDVVEVLGGDIIVVYVDDIFVRLALDIVYTFPSWSNFGFLSLWSFFIADNFSFRILMLNKIHHHHRQISKPARGCDVCYDTVFPVIHSSSYRRSCFRISIMNLINLIRSHCFQNGCLCLHYFWDQRSQDSIICFSLRDQSQPDLDFFSVYKPHPLVFASPSFPTIRWSTRHLRASCFIKYQQKRKEGEGETRSAIWILDGKRSVVEVLGGVDGDIIVVYVDDVLVRLALDWLVPLVIHFRVDLISVSYPLIFFFYCRYFSFRILMIIVN